MRYKLTGRPLPRGIWGKVLLDRGTKRWRWTEPSRFRNWTMEHMCDLDQWRKVKKVRDEQKARQESIEHLAQIYQNWEW